MILSPALKECATDLLTFASVLIAQVIRGLSTEGSAHTLHAQVKSNHSRRMW
jgi:hypothetical protein